MAEPIVHLVAPPARKTMIFGQEVSLGTILALVLCVVVGVDIYDRRVNGNDASAARPPDHAPVKAAAKAWKAALAPAYRAVAGRVRSGEFAALDPAKRREAVGKAITDGLHPAGLEMVNAQYADADLAGALDATADALGGK